jgi:hypothetical protein
MLAYVIRIFVNLLVEPTINPIKHFPVVTVAAKLMLPFYLTLAHLIATPLRPLLGTVISHTIAAGTTSLLPGFFGFLVWELRSNWRLYEANRPKSLGPIPVGSHGETVVRFVRPGFHSGTLPKLFVRLRRTRRAGRERAGLKHREGLHHVEEAVRRLLKRDFAALLHESRSLGEWSIEPGSIHLATNRIGAELVSVSHDRPNLRIDLEERLGLFAATVSQPGWLDDLGAPERRTLADALAGLYKICGIALIEAPAGLFDAARAAPSLSAAACEPLAGIDFAAVEISWPAWVKVWQDEAEQKGPTSAA